MSVKRKLYYLTTSAMLFIGNVMAQDGPISNPFQESGGLFPFLAEFYGLSNPFTLQNVGYASFFAAIVYLQAVGLESMVRLRDSRTLKRTLGIESGERPTRLYVLSTLIVLSLFTLGPSVFFAQAQAFGGFMTLAIQAYILLGVGLALVGILSTVGFIGNTGGAALETGGEGAGNIVEGGAGGLREFGEGIQRAGQKLRGAEQDTKDGNTDQAEVELEEALEIMEQEAEKIESLFEKDFTQLKNTLEQLRNDFQARSETADGFKWLEGHESHVRQQLGFIWQMLIDIEHRNANPVIDNGQRNTLIDGGDHDYMAPAVASNIRNTTKTIDGLDSLGEELTQVRDHITDRIGKWEKYEESSIEDEIDTVLEDANEILQAHEILNTLNNEVQESENEDEALRQVAEKANDKNLFRDSAEFHEKIEYLDDKLSQLRSEEEDIRDEFYEIKNGLQEVLELDETERNEVEQNIVADNKIGQILDNEIIPKLENDFDDTQPNVQEVLSGCRDLESLASDIQQEVMDIFDATQMELKQERQLLQRINEIIDKLDN